MNVRSCRHRKRPIILTAAILVAFMACTATAFATQRPSLLPDESDPTFIADFYTADDAEEVYGVDDATSEEATCSEEGVDALAATPSAPGSSGGSMAPMATDDDLDKSGTLTITNEIVNSWEDDANSFEIFVEISGLEHYGDFTFTLTKSDGSVSLYTLKPDSNVMESIDILTKKEITGNRTAQWSFLMKDGEKVVISEIPTGAHYQCYIGSQSASGTFGTGYNQKYLDVYEAQNSNTSGTFSVGSSYTVNERQARQTGVVVVIKALLNGLDSNASFCFRLTLLQDDNQTPVSNFKVGTGLDGTDIVTDESGHAEFTVKAGQGQALQYLPAGANYVIEENLGDSDRYELYEVPAQATGVVEHKAAPTALNFFNIEKTKVSFEKQDAAGHLIGGAKLQVLDQQGNVVMEWTSEEGKPAEFWLDMTTGDTTHGIPGYYVLHEEAPPAGYELADDIKFTVTYPGIGGTPQVKLDDGTAVSSVAMVDEERPREITVTKSWDDNDDAAGKRPAKVEVQLLADGEAYGNPVTLSKSSSWSYTWADLPWHKDGAEISYSVQELEVADYTSTISGNADDGFVITNVYGTQDEAAPSSKGGNPAAGKGSGHSPRTGDFLIFGVLGLLLAAGVAVLAIARTRRHC